MDKIILFDLLNVECFRYQTDTNNVFDHPICNKSIEPNSTVQQVDQIHIHIFNISFSIQNN